MWQIKSVLKLSKVSKHFVQECLKMLLLVKSLIMVQGLESSYILTQISEIYENYYHQPKFKA